MEVLMFNIAAPVNAQVTGVNMAFNPLTKNENDIFHFQFAWQNSLEEQLYNELEETLNSRIRTALKMSNINDANITFTVNSYQNINSN